MTIHSLESSAQRVLGDQSIEQYKACVEWGLAIKLRGFVNGFAASRALAAQPAPAVVPDGWKLVPLEPTAEMLQAGQDAPVSESDEDAPEDYKAVYRAMLAAAPRHHQAAHVPMTDVEKHHGIGGEPQQIAGLDKDAEITALNAERDALLKNDARYRFVVGSTDHSVAKWHDCEGWYAIEEADLDADMQAQGVKTS